MGALPVRGTDAEAWLGRAAALASHFAASVVGSLLLVMAYGLLRRLSIAWWGSLLLLLNAAVVVWARGESWWLWGAVLLTAALLAALRGAFYRDARLTREPLSDQALVPLAAVAVCGISLALVAYSGGPFSDESWWEVVLSREAPWSLRFTVGLTGVLLLVGVVRLLRPARLGVVGWDDGARRRLRALGALAPVQADGAVFGQEQRAGFAFLKRDRIWLALGDPAGDRQDAISAIWRFRDACERAGVDPAFWRVGPDLLRVYEDIGLTAVPLAAPGEEAKHFLACRAERDLQALRQLLPPALQRELPPGRKAAVEAT
ncbi:phosphatidylglycerol lysyltransferase domain-containing protein [Craurococcus roseus]